MTTQETIEHLTTMAQCHFESAMKAATTLPKRLDTEDNPLASSVVRNILADCERCLLNVFRLRHGMEPHFGNEDHLDMQAQEREMGGIDG